MMAMRRSPFVRRVVIPLTLVGFLAGCTHWATVDPPWAEAIAESQPDKVRVTLADETKLVVTSPVLACDSLTGLVKAPSEKAPSEKATTEKAVQRPDGVWAIPNNKTVQDKIAFQTPVSNLLKIEQRKVSALKTTLLPVGLLAVAGIAAIAIWCVGSTTYC